MYLPACNASMCIADAATPNPVASYHVTTECMVRRCNYKYNVNEACVPGAPQGHCSVPNVDFPQL